MGRQVRERDVAPGEFFLHKEAGRLLEILHRPGRRFPQQVRESWWVCRDVRTDQVLWAKHHGLNRRRSFSEMEVIAWAAK